MARISKRAGKTLYSEPAGQITGSVWKAGIYARLSVDSNDRKNESIDTQIQIAEEYISQTDDIELADIYTDLGKTGRNFEREGFERLMADIRRKKINCIIVKDFSRFGRDYIETGNYIEKILPFMKVRFIAVTDNYDSEYVAGENARLSMNLKNIVNELYAKDIAQRVKTAKKLKREMGSFTGGIPPYGYRAEKTGDKKVLFPEMVTKDIVVWIYEMYAEGNTYKEIAEELYKKKVQQPAAYRATGEVCCLEDGMLQQWPYASIRRILTNPVYSGTLSVPADREAMVENTHEPVVSEDLFYKVSQRFEKQRKYGAGRDIAKQIPQNKIGQNKIGQNKIPQNKISQNKIGQNKIYQNEDIFKDKIYCGECGRHLIRSSSVKTLSSGDRVRSYYYSCPNKRKIDGSVCESQGISLKKLAAVIKSVLEKEFVLSEMHPRDICRENKKEAEKKKDMIKRQKERCLREQKKVVLEGSKCYFKYREGQLSQEAFLDKKRQAEEEMEELRKMGEDLERKEQLIEKESDKISRFIRALISQGHFGSDVLRDADSVQQKTTCWEDAELDKELVKCLIKRINVFCGHQMEIIFHYTGG